MHAIPLSPRAIEILKRREETAKNEWVFPGKFPGTHLFSVQRAWLDLLKVSGLKDLRPHDLRRTAASYMAIHGVSIQKIGKVLNHKDASSTAIYARLQVDALAEPITAMSSVFAKARSGK